MKVLYIGNNIEKVQGGAEQVNKRNIGLLFHAFGKENVKILPMESDSSLYTQFFFGAGRKFIQKVFQKIEMDSCDILFLSQSLYGKIAKKVKRKYPKITIITFFHNIEKHYASELISASGISHFPFYFAATCCEKMAVQHSDYLILLNERDNLLLKKIYGAFASLLLPTSFADTFEKERIIRSKQSDEITYLFVGTAFFANIQGIQWFIKNVLPFVPGNLLVVGKGMKSAVEENEKVRVWDYVEDLSDFYYQTNLVILPIFVGGGMKTKTAEALMYGKTILANFEALQGYPNDAKVIYECNTKEDYVLTISKLMAENKTAPYNERSRVLYEKHCSFDSSMERFTKWLSSENILNKN